MGEEEGHGDHPHEGRGREQQGSVARRRSVPRADNHGRCPSRRDRAACRGSALDSLPHRRKFNLPFHRWGKVGRRKLVDKKPVRGSCSDAVGSLAPWCIGTDRGAKRMVRVPVVRVDVDEGSAERGVGSTDAARLHAPPLWSKSKSGVASGSTGSKAGVWSRSSGGSPSRGRSGWGGPRAGASAGGWVGNSR